MSEDLSLSIYLFIYLSIYLSITLFSSSERLHTGVKSWTKSINIFDKKMILVPVYDWYVSIRAN